MLKYNFKRLLQLRGISKPLAFLTNKGFSYSEAFNISHNKFIALKISQIEKLCNLFKCTPNDLFEWTPKTKEEDNPNHPLYSLKRDEEESITKSLSELPIEIIQHLKKVIDETKNNLNKNAT